MSTLHELLKQEISAMVKHENYELIKKQFEELLEVISKIESSDKKVPYRKELNKVRKRCPCVSNILQLRAEEIDSLSESQCLAALQDLILLKAEVEEPEHLLMTIHDKKCEWSYKLNHDQKYLNTI